MSSFSGRLSPKRLCAIIHLHVYCTYVYMYTRIHVYIYTCIHVYIHTYIHIYIYMYIYTYIHAYIYTYIHIYIYTYIHVHIHTNTTVHHASTLQCQTLMMEDGQELVLGHYSIADAAPTAGDAPARRARPRAAGGERGQYSARQSACSGPCASRDHERAAARGTQR